MPTTPQQISNQIIYAPKHWHTFSFSLLTRHRQSGALYFGVCGKISFKLNFTYANFYFDLTSFPLARSLDFLSSILPISRHFSAGWFIYSNHCARLYRSVFAPCECAHFFLSFLAPWLITFAVFILAVGFSSFFFPLKLILIFQY